MISIFIMYSNDRKRQLNYTISCLRDMYGYEDCQKMLVVDGKFEYRHPWEWEPEYPEWDVVEVPRINNQFCWSDMWQAGVCTAQHQTVLYLDSDRLLPKNYLQKIEQNIADKRFLFCSKHFMVTNPNLSLSGCKRFLDRFDEEPELFLEDEFVASLKFEARYQNPMHAPGKNVMSGNTAFTRKTFFGLGGVDRHYRGHGAFADTDFHLQAKIGGCEFMDLDAPEIHYHHVKRDDHNQTVDEDRLRLMGLDNFIYYCKKWDLTEHYAMTLALNIGVENPIEYVRSHLSPRD